MPQNIFFLHKHLGTQSGYFRLLVTMSSLSIGTNHNTEYKTNNKWKKTGKEGGGGGEWEEGKGKRKKGGGGKEKEEERKKKKKSKQKMEEGKKKEEEASLQLASFNPEGYWILKIQEHALGIVPKIHTWNYLLSQLGWPHECVVADDWTTPPRFIIYSMPPAWFTPLRTTEYTSMNEFAAEIIIYKPRFTAMPVTHRVDMIYRTLSSNRIPVLNFKLINYHSTIDNAAFLCRSTWSWY